jgi:hypothetical protein
MLYLEVVPLALSVFTTGLSYWIYRAVKKQSQIAVAAATSALKESTAANQSATTAATHVVSSGRKVCSACGRVVARYSVVAGELKCLNCIGSK